MKALTLVPKKAGSLELRDVPEPTARPGQILCELIMLGICGTDVEISKGLYGEAPAGAEFLILGHESLGRVIKTGAGSKFSEGDLVVGFVRHPDPKPCAHCAVGEWDLCSNGGFQEHGIKGLNGFACEKYVLDEDHCIKLDPKLHELGVLIEPTSVVAKAWEHALKIAERSKVAPKTVLITGAGPVGQLAALIGKQKGFDVHYFDHNQSGPKVDLAKELGATYHSDLASLQALNVQFDLTFECTGVPDVILSLFEHISQDGILCLTGVSSGGRQFPLDVGAFNLKMVLQNQVIFGSVNANRRHYDAAEKVLLTADPMWLAKLITRRVKLSAWADAFAKQKTDIKVVLVNENPRA